MKSFKNLGNAKSLDVTTHPKDFITESTAQQELQEPFLFKEHFGEQGDFVEQSDF